MWWYKFLVRGWEAHFALQFSYIQILSFFEEQINGALA